MEFSVDFEETAVDSCQEMTWKFHENPCNIFYRVGRKVNGLIHCHCHCQLLFSIAQLRLKKVDLSTGAKALEIKKNISTAVNIS